MQFGSQVAAAVAQASGYSSDWNPGLGIFICCGCGPKKTKTKEESEWQNNSCLPLIEIERPGRRVWRGEVSSAF